MGGRYTRAKIKYYATMRYRSWTSKSSDSLQKKKKRPMRRMRRGPAPNLADAAVELTMAAQYKAADNVPVPAVTHVHISGSRSSSPKDDGE